MKIEEVQSSATKEDAAGVQHQVPLRFTTMNECGMSAIDTDTVPVCHKERVTKSSCYCYCNEPTKTHERLVREELALLV
jgi:hypothetical protein